MSKYGQKLSMLKFGSFVQKFSNKSFVAFTSFFKNSQPFNLSPSDEISSQRKKLIMGTKLFYLKISNYGLKG
jgi:hypothetical protein